MVSPELTCEVVVTAPESAWLANLARSLVEHRLCAGAHVIPEIRSVYRWEGELVDRAEARVALHTRRSLLPEVEEFIAKRHPYQVPCVIALPITDGNPDYLAWIISETREPRRPGAVSEES